MESKRLELIVFSVLFVGLSVLTFFVFRPFLHVLVLAAVLSVLFHPLYTKLIGPFRGGRSVSTCLVVVIALVFLIIPVSFFGLQIFAQAQNFFSLSQAGQGAYMQAIQDNVDTLVQHVVPAFTFNITDSVKSSLGFLSDNFGGLLSQTTYISFQIFFLLFAFFFFVRDGERMLDRLVALSPFTHEQNREIMSSVSRTITSVIRGTLFVGLIRLILFTLAFYFLGIPDALLWGSIGGIIGMIPGLGTPFAIIPAFLYLLFYGTIIQAIGMAIFGGLIFFFIDNMLSAYFFGKGLHVSAPFILFSILGGVIFFGPLGFIFGPIILSLFISMIDMYRILVLKKAA